MKKTKTTLRICAAMAKQRISAGFWDVPRNRATILNLNEPNCEEEQFYRRVECLIRDGEQNPLSHFLDLNYMNGLDDGARQRYVLMMSQKVNNSVARYNKVC